MSVDVWTEQHAPRTGDVIQLRDEDSGEVHAETFTVIANDGPVPADRLADSMPWKCWWSVLVECPNLCGCEGLITAEGQCRHWFLLTADSFVKVETA